MKTKTSNQNTSTSPRFKRRGLIYLGLLFILGILMAPIQSFAQDAINVDATSRLTSQQFESVVNAIAPQIAPKQFNQKKIQTRWENVNATPSWVSVSYGGKVYISGRLMSRNSNGSYSPMANQRVALVLGDGRVFYKVTESRGWVEIRFNIKPRPGIYRPGQSVAFPFGWVYPSTQTFERSKGNSGFTITS